MTPSDSSLDSRNLNTLWASVLVETLARRGVRHAVISPGSRSAPLTAAFAAHPEIAAEPVLDERSAAFFALGMAKRLGQPVALVCTSGTAAANYFPAVIEARESAVPLVVLTADRPPELRACGSGQTIDQQKIYGDHAVFFHELALPGLTTDLFRYLRQTVAHAVARALGPIAGAVHLNVPFRDPLAPVADGGEAAAFAHDIDWHSFFSQLTPPESRLVAGEPPRLVPDSHGVIVVGPQLSGEREAALTAVAEIARRLGWPVLADGLSPVRNRAFEVPHLVTTYDTVLRNAATAERLKPEAVLCLGGWPTSKVLRAWVEGSEARVWMAAERIDNRDALHGRTVHLGASLPALAATLPTAAEEANGYERMWARCEEKIRPAIDQRFLNEKAFFEPKIAWLLARHLPPHTPLFVASSMPARDVEYVWPPNDRAVQPFSNRGANGIDGTLSTALGVAHVAHQPAVLLTGDLALLHDSNGFLLRSRLQGSLTIVLVNNRGGGIFEHLPIAGFEPPFEDYFATPQEADFEKLCAAHGVAHTLVKDWPQFRALIGELPQAGIRVIEVRTDRKADAAMRKAWFAELAALLG
ncbi:MAG: 2-succinyl-5-enolpyruvyl-6-hydroxy-3-cyclohexene-1-carboxylic-acid synthase [Opitutaceae bacterium]|nr:2-succinyl-5-enolpyruvyl-6-hydroxy-3-cyclohexene-1-carboxylic-acid synthase [Opitutaceae bacterium]